MSHVRLQKHIADLGICSRRKAEELIQAGKVKVNGEVVSEMGIKINPEHDKVTVAGELGTTKKETLVYIALNKPVDFISSASNEQGKSVLDLLSESNCIGRDKKDVEERVYPVGRLDKDSEGLVLLTNDGALTNQLTHPRYEHEKEYEVIIDKPLTRDTRAVLQKGMKLGDEFVKGIKIVKEFNKGRQTVVTVILTEGKNRQLKKMFGRLGYHVQTLRRIRIGNLKLGTLPVGRWKFVRKSKIV